MLVYHDHEIIQIHVPQSLNIDLELNQSSNERTDPKRIGSDYPINHPSGYPSVLTINYQLLTIDY